MQRDQSVLGSDRCQALPRLPAALGGGLHQIADRLLDATGRIRRHLQRLEQVARQLGVLLGGGATESGGIGVSWLRL